MADVRSSAQDQGCWAALEGRQQSALLGTVSLDGDGKDLQTPGRNREKKKRRQNQKRKMIKEDHQTRWSLP